MKPGFLTSEFAVTLLTIFAAIVGAVLSSGVVESGSTIALVLSIAAAVLVALGYQVARTSLKKKQIEADTDPKLTE